MNYIWGVLIAVGIIYGVLTGNVDNVNHEIIESAREATETCITVIGILCMWMGILKIAEKSGLLETVSNKMKKILTFLYPEIPVGHRARKYISLNMIANFLGLGWAATPFGIKAMKEMKEINKDKKSASNAMCMFLLINISSIQLISINIIAYRVKYNSVNPTEIIIPGILATICSTVVAIIYAKIKTMKDELKL